MLFSEPTFLFFFMPALLAVYFLVPKIFRNSLLLAASLVFYAYGERMFVLLMLVSIGFNYVIGLGIGSSDDQSTRKRFMLAGVAGDLALLIAFKYANFLVDNLNAVTGLVGIPAVDLAPVHLPIGISFFTFQAMSYVIDVYRREVDIQRNPIHLALYIALFPQLIAGPIVRYHDIALQLARRTINAGKFAYGVQRFVIGLSKKMIIANAVAWPADQIFALPGDQLTTSLAWFAMLCYSLQIYFDFSGYSDMAIGLGRMFGFKFLENFNYPYISRSITEFWRRWHISLSSWYRDYLYIPLGGNRISAARTYFNLMTVFLLCGFWHGSSWNFVIWGVFHGLFLIIERVGLGKLLAKLPGPVTHLYVLFTVVIAWVPFRAETLSQTTIFLAAMAGFDADPAGTHHSLSLYVNAEVMLAILFGVIGATPILPAFLARWKAWRRGLSGSARNSAAVIGAITRNVALFLLFYYCLTAVAGGSYNPFIYFRF